MCQQPDGPMECAYSRLELSPGRGGAQQLRRPADFRANQRRDQRPKCRLLIVSFARRDADRRAKKAMRGCTMSALEQTGGWRSGCREGHALPRGISRIKNLLRIAKESSIWRQSHEAAIAEAVGLTTIDFRRPHGATLCLSRDLTLSTWASRQTWYCIIAIALRLPVP